MSDYIEHACPRCGSYICRGGCVAERRQGKPVPIALRCRWEKRPGPLSICADCGEWTANRPAYEKDICPAKDRRVGRACD